MNYEKGNQTRKMILEKIIEYIQNHGYSPSVREICDMTGIRSTGTVKYQLDKMIEHGMIESDHEHAPRTIRVPGYEFKKITKNEKGH